MNAQYQIGYLAAQDESPGLIVTLDDKSADFVKGFCDCKREQETLSSNSSADTLDY